MSTPRQQICAEVTAHLVSRLNETPVVTEPFPHIHFEQAFPQAVYARLLRELPPVERYEAFESKHYSSNGEANRFRLSLRDRPLAELPEEQRALWQGVRDAIGSLAVQAAVFQVLRCGLAYRFGIPQEAVGQLEAHPLPELYRETKGYSIAPHPDTRKKLVTMQFALAPDASYRDMGTALYRRRVNVASLLSPSRRFEKVKQFDFLPNSAYAFVVLNTLGKKSWHGREVLTDDHRIRNTLLNIYYAKADQGNPDIAGRGPTAVRRAA